MRINKGKAYEFSTFGYVKMLWDFRQERLGKINSIISIGIIVGMFAMGILGKEIFIIMLANIGIGKVTNWLIG